MTARGDVIYPAGLPLPTIANYSFDQPQSFTRLDVGDGPSRFRPVNIRPPAPIRVRWVFQDSEMYLFRIFYQSNLANGALWFDMPLDTGEIGPTEGNPSTRAIVVRTVHFLEGPTVARFGAHWEVTAPLEAENLDVEVPQEPPPEPGEEDIFELRGPWLFEFGAEDCLDGITWFEKTGQTFLSAGDALNPLAILQSTAGLNDAALGLERVGKALFHNKDAFDGDLSGKGLATDATIDAFPNGETIAHMRMLIRWDAVVTNGRTDLQIWESTTNQIEMNESTVERSRIIFRDDSASGAEDLFTTVVPDDWYLVDFIMGPTSLQVFYNKAFQINAFAGPHRLPRVSTLAAFGNRNRNNYPSISMLWWGWREYDGSFQQAEHDADVDALFAP